MPEMPWRRLAATSSGLLLILATSGSPAARAQDDQPVTELFSDEAGASGLDFTHFNGMTGALYYVENMGSGAGLLDYDGDGDLDVYLVQGRMLGKDETAADALFPPSSSTVLTDRLFRNDLALDPAGEVRLRFVDVTESSGIAADGYGMGVAAGDYNNDGWTDLYVTNFGSNQMWRNNGDGTFSDVTHRSDTDDSRWSVSAAFWDYDRDGWLDLYVGNYVEYRLATDRKCVSQTGAPDYCGPLAYAPVHDSLFRNRGDGSFEDVSESAGLLNESPGGGLGVTAGDFDGDGWLDLYVANDMTPNHLWINQRDGSFRNDALLAGCAVNAEGKAEASMGVDAGDFDRDGDLDLFMAHLSGETNTLYLNDGNGIFRDQTLLSGLGNPSWDYTGFGAAWFDFDNDTHLDLMTVNGSVRNLPALVQTGDPYPLHQPNQLFRNLGDGRFKEASSNSAAAFSLSEVSRGAAFGDIDNDGDVDVVVTNNAGPVRLLVNRVGSGSNWVGARPIGGQSLGGRELLGTRLRVTTAEGNRVWGRSRTDGSYASSNDSRVSLGLDRSDGLDELQVQWPDSRSSRWQRPPSNVFLTLPRAER
jgi:hypothetical protein